jgi:hypothetical protein
VVRQLFERRALLDLAGADLLDERADGLEEPAVIGALPGLRRWRSYDSVGRCRLLGARGRQG